MPVVERRTESGTGEAAGSWSLGLKVSTPKHILDFFDLNDESARFATLVITAQRVDPSAFSAADLRAKACYVGVLRGRTSELGIGGSGVAVLLGNEDGSSEIPTSNVTFSGTTLSTALDSYLPSNGITKGSVTNTGTNITDTLPAYVSRRDLIHQIVDKCGGEWRLTTDTSGNIDLDAAVNATLFGSTPPAMVIETTGGPEPGIIGLEAVELDQSHDIEDFATKQYVLARASGGVTVGSATSGASTSYFNGTAIKMEAVTDSSDTDGTNANTVASLLLGSRQTIKRNVTVTVNPLDIVGKTWGPSGASASSVRCGDSIYIYDPVYNLVDTANQVTYRGEVRFPLKSRIYGITWPVLGGMGVYLLTADSSPTVIDLSDWYEPETGSATLDVGAQVRSVFSAGPSAPLSPYGDMPTTLVSDSWTTYTPTWSSSGTQPAIGNGILDGGYQRTATGIRFRIRLIPGSTTTFGTGTYFLTAPAATGAAIPPQVVTAILYDTSTGIWYSHTGYLPTSSSAIQFPRGNGSTDQFGATTPVTLANGDVFIVSGNIEAATA